jgi:hypothetical protein
VRKHLLVDNSSLKGLQKLSFKAKELEAVMFNV